MEWVGVGAGLPCGLTLPKVPYCSYLPYLTKVGRYLQVDVVARRGCLGTRRHGRKDATHHFRHESAMIESTMLGLLEPERPQSGSPPRLLYYYLSLLLLRQRKVHVSSLLPVATTCTYYQLHCLV